MNNLTCKNRLILKFVYRSKYRNINTDIATGDLVEEVSKIKRQNGRDIIVYGGASFDSSLIKEKLIDEFYLFINPVAIGNGMTIFKDLNEIQKYTLIESKVFECGKDSYR